LSTELHVIIDKSELIEACAVLALWNGRAAELPLRLREELLALTASDIVTVVDGPVVAVELTPRLRAVIANLRARR
jgi:hypothetical protein